MQKILIIEDDPSIGKVLRDKLKSSGFHLVHAVDGVEAIQLFKKEKPALVLVDLILPKKSGFEVMEEIRIKLKSAVPLIVLSNLDQPQDREAAKRFGVSDYIVKSNVSLSDLVMKIHRLLTKSAGERT